MDRPCRAAQRQHPGVDPRRPGEKGDSALPEVYPSLFDDLELVSTSRRPIKRVIYLNEGGDRVIEAAVVLSAAPAKAEVTAGEIHIVLHPLRALLS